MRPAVLISAIVVGVILVGGATAAFLVSNAAREAQEKKDAAAAALEALETERDEALGTFRAAMTSCGLSSSNGVSIGEGGDSMTIDHSNYAFLASSKTASTEELECMLTELEVPLAAQSIMWETRALDGRQSEDWDTDWGTMEISWSYHPDDGLDTVWSLELNEELAALD